MIEFTKIQLTHSLCLYPWDLREQASKTDIIHHKDKSTLEAYDFLFKCYPKKVNSIFEIGVKNGGSLALWNLVFPKAKILGIDLNISQVLPTTQAYLTSKGVQAIECNCLEVPRVTDLIQELGEVDLIIDDGQHTFETILPSLNQFWKYLSKDGFYIVEDWQSFNPAHRTLLLSQIIDFLISNWETKEGNETAHSIHLLKDFIAIVKK